MPFLRTLRLGSDSRYDYRDTPPTSLLMRNAFLILRLVFLALFCNFALLALIFAAWNVNASISVGIPTTSSAIFIIFQSCLVFAGVILALADLFRPKARMSRTMVECSWVGVLSVFQLGGAMGTVIGSPQSACNIDAEHNVCVSASLLVPISWLIALLLMTYFLVLFISTMAHKAVYPDIWKRTIYSINWFDQSRGPLSKEMATTDDTCSASVFDDKDIYAAFYHDLESTSTRKLKYTPDEPAPWARSPSPVRRGIDHPFARKPGQAWTRPSPAASAAPSLPSFPDRSADPFALASPGSAGAGGMRGQEKFREAGLLARAESPAAFAQHHHARSMSGPLSTLELDLDQPIPLTRLSEWVKAEDMRHSRVSGHGALFA